MSVQLPSNIGSLIKTFDTYASNYTSAQYNETLLRDDFLDPFFRELGWDLSNTNGLPHASREVIKEEALVTKQGVKAPDFTFRTGGVRRFFVEAKRPSIAIKTGKAAAYQLRRYAWSAKLPLSILTSFKEFAVYDGRVRPSPNDAASKGRIFHCRYDELEEHWEWIEATFSKEAVAAGSLDRWLEKNKGTRGKSEVDEDFLKTIEKWRTDLAKNLAKNNSALTERDINYSVQRIIDRIIFLRICEARAIEEYGTLRSAAGKAKVYSHLVVLFQNADQKYNSGLFHFENERSRDETPDTLTLDLSIDDTVLKSIIKELYYPNSPYEFSVLPSDILGQVYEQFLGKVIRLTAGHCAVVEFKPEVKKAGGVYYTPTYIVDYIVRNTLGALTRNKTPSDIKDVSVLDPACGSGSFLIQAYQFLLDWYLAYYTSNNPQKAAKGQNAAVIELAPNQWRLTLAERKRILLRHIFGVDIDYQAVEVTKLSLLLKVLEGETEQTIQPTLAGLADRALPDLGNNIKCGNSLINPDYFDGEFQFDDEQFEKVNAFDWSGADGFPKIMSNGGFSIVIGNPPYIFARELLSQREKQYYSLRYNLAWEKHNTYLLFMEALLGLVAKKGMASFIVPNSWLTIESAKKLRAVYIGLITEIIDFNFAAFKNVSMEPTVFIIDGDVSSADPAVSRINARSEFDNRAVRTAARSEWQVNGDRITFSDGNDRAQLDILRSRLGNIGDHFDVRTGLQAYERGKGTPPQTAADVLNHVFDADRKLDASTHRYLEGRDVGAFTIDWSGNWMRYGPWLSQPRELPQFTRPRVLIREITSPYPYCLGAAFTDDKYLSNKSVLTVLQSTDDVDALKALACVLNSALMSVFYKEYAVKSARRLFPKVLIKNLREYPFPVAMDSHANRKLGRLYDRFVAAVQAMATAKSHQVEARRRLVTSLRAKVDDEVCTYFGLSTDEKDLIRKRAFAALPAVVAVA